MGYVIPDRQEAARLRYQLRRFEKQCSDLPVDTRNAIQAAMGPLRELLAAGIEVDALEDQPGTGNRCDDYGLDRRYAQSELSERYYCTKCGKQREAE